MSCHEANERTPLPENRLAKARQRADWPKGRSLNVWTTYFGVTDLFETVSKAIGDELPRLTARRFMLGIWHVSDAGDLSTNYLGVDVAREFPGCVGIAVFKYAVARVGEQRVHQLRCAHQWRDGRIYYPGDSEHHAVHTLFLIPSLDYWREHQREFIRLAADVNAAI